MTTPTDNQVPKGTPMLDAEAGAVANAVFATRRLEHEQRMADRPAIREQGVEALQRLMAVAKRDTGQSRVVARFLLGCYNGLRFPFDLSDFRLLDYELFEDCLAVLKMDKQPEMEVHQYFKFGGRMFENLASSWRMDDHMKLMAELHELRLNASEAKS